MSQKNAHESITIFHKIDHPKWLPLQLLKIVNNMKQTISHELPNGFCQNVCPTDAIICSQYEGTKQVQHNVLWKSCFFKCLRDDSLSICHTLRYRVCVINSSYSFLWIFLKHCILVVDIMKMCMWVFDIARLNFERIKAFRI